MELSGLKNLIAEAGMPLSDEGGKTEGLFVYRRRHLLVIESRAKNGSPREFRPAESEFLFGPKFIEGLIARGVKVETLGKMFGYVETNRRKQALLRSLPESARRALARDDRLRTMLWESLDPDKRRYLPESIDELMSAKANRLPRIYSRVDISVWPPRRSIVHSEWTESHPTLGTIRVDHVSTSFEVSNDELRAILKGLVPEQSLPAVITEQSLHEILAQDGNAEKLFHAPQDKKFATILEMCPPVRMPKNIVVHSADQNRPLPTKKLVEHAVYTMEAPIAIFGSVMKSFNLHVQGIVKFAWVDNHQGPQVVAVSDHAHVARHAPENPCVSRGSVDVEFNGKASKIIEENADLRRVADIAAKAQIAEGARSVAAALRQLAQSIAGMKQ